MDFHKEKYTNVLVIKLLYNLSKESSSVYSPTDKYSPKILFKK